MNIKDSYLHGGTHVVKNIQFGIASSGANNGKLVATITWAQEGVDNTELVIPISGATFGTQTKNTVYAAPSSADGAPSFRALVAADIPEIGAGKITSGTLVADRLPLATNEARGAVILGVAADNTTNITGKLYWVKMNANGKIYVDVPWDTNTHYTAVPVLGGSAATSNATSDTANDATYLNIVENSTKSGGVQITGAGGTSVKANAGKLTITSTWRAANSTLNGYVPQLASGGTALANSTNDYVLAFTYASSGTLTPTWKKLPANAYLNTWRGIQDNLTSSTNTTESLSAKQGYLLANGSARDDTKLPLAGGTMTGAIKRYYSAASNDPMIALTANNQDIWLWRINHGTSVNVSTSGVYGYGLKYLGTNTDETNNDLVLYADHSTGTQVAAITVKQTGVVKFNSTPNVNGTNVSLVGHKHAYTDLTGSTTTANQAIVSNGTANGWTLKTLGSRAFDSTSYLPLAGGTMTGPINVTSDGTIDTTKAGINFGTVGRIGANTTGLGIYSTNKIFIRPSQTISEGEFTFTGGIELSSTTFTYNGNTVYHSGNIPSNTKDAAGIVAKGVASRVYMTDSTGAPAWREYDTTVTESSGKLITSGGVYTAIANSVAGAVQYLGTVASEAAMIALTNAGQGDFARVTTAFTFTDATGASVTAHVGDVVYLTNNTPGTSSNWIVAHTEIDTNTWTAASTSAAGYVPKLVIGGTALASSSNDYILAFVNGTNTAPVWRKLPANAYLNDNTTGVKLASSISGTKKTDTTLIKIGSGTGLSIMGGTNKFTIGDGTNYIEVGVAHGLSTQNININGTDYAIYTSADSLPTIKAPTGYGTANLILATNANGNGLTWVTKPTSNVTTSLYIGASNGTSTAAQSTNGNVHLILKEGSSYTRYKITGSGRATVTSDANGTITINSAGYSTFVKSGSSAAAGLVPKPDTTAGTTKFLCEDGTWKLPSYTTNTDERVKQSESVTTEYRGIVLGKNSSATANTGIADTITSQVYVTNNLVVQPSTGNVISLGTGTFSTLYASVGLQFDGTGTLLWTGTDTTILRVLVTKDTTDDTAVFRFQQGISDGSSITWSNLMTIKDNSKVVATTFVGALSGNASTASNLSKGDSRGYLYQSAGTTTGCTGVGSVSAATEIGIPYIGYSGSANTYGIYKNLFYLSGTTKYIHGDVHSTKFACVKTLNSTTDDWDGSTTSGTSTGGGTTYSAGDGITISGTTISTSNKEWYGTEAQFNALTSLNSNTTYYIIAN